jgi:hypothetical protein
MKKKPTQTKTTPASKKIIWVPAPKPKTTSKKVLTAAQANGRTASGQVCALCGADLRLGALATHRCNGLTGKVKVRKLSSLPRKQQYVKVKSHFQSKLSDESGGWY